MKILCAKKYSGFHHQGSECGKSGLEKIFFSVQIDINLNFEIEKQQ